MQHADSNKEEIIKCFHCGNETPMKKVGEYAPRNGIYNAFLMPFQKPQGEEFPYRFVSVGVADWKTYGPGSENYNYVLGILVDTKHLITTYSGHNAREINQLSSYIEDSLTHYRLVQ